MRQLDQFQRKLDEFDVQSAPSISKAKKILMKPGFNKKDVLSISRGAYSLHNWVVDVIKRNEELKSQQKEVSIALTDADFDKEAARIPDPDAILPA